MKQIFLLEFSCFFYAKPLTVWITTNCGKFFKRWEYQTTILASWEICIQVNKQQLEPFMEQQTGSKLGKEYVRAAYYHSTYLTYTQSTCKCWDGWITSWNQDCQEKINNLRYADDTTLMAESDEELKSLLMVKENFLNNKGI